MTAITGRLAGYRARLWRVTTVITSKTETNIETALGTATNEVIDVSDMSTGLTSERPIIDVNVYGEDTGSSVPGQAAAGTFDFTATFNGDNATHVAIRDDNGSALSTYIVEIFRSSTEKTYAAFDGSIATASVTLPFDGVASLECVIARSGGITWVDNA